jgi:hypothetical protein
MWRQHFDLRHFSAICLEGLIDLSKDSGATSPHWAHRYKYRPLGYKTVCSVVSLGKFLRNLLTSSSSTLKMQAVGTGKNKVHPKQAKNTQRWSRGVALLLL